VGHLTSGRRKKDSPPKAGAPSGEASGVDLARIAADQYGIVSVRQLRALGFDDFATKRRVTWGFLHPVYRGVYAVGHRSLSVRGTYLAAVLACGPRSALSHRAAAAIWNLWPRWPRVEVTVPRGRVGPSAIRVYRSRMLNRTDFTVVDGIRTTTVARTLLDLAGAVSGRQLGRAIDRAERQDLFDLSDVEQVLSRAGGRSGASALCQALERWRPRNTRSELEDRWLDLVQEAGAPEPQTNVLVQGERYVHEVDAFWPDHRLVVELDSFAHHRTRRDHERDAATSADLELAGHHVVHLSWDDVVVRREETCRRLRRLLSRTLPTATART
jgi:hypothetical protein